MVQTATSTPSTSPSNIYDKLGLKSVINARGNNTVLGGSTPSPRVRRAMEESERYYVDMHELLERSGQIVAELLGCEAAYITPGAAAALALGTAACITGNEIDKMARLPDTTGLKNTVLIQPGHHYRYERAVTVPGARLVEVGDAQGTTRAQLESALGPNVAAVLFPAHLDGTHGTLSLREVVSVARAKGVPVLVDAAGRIFPLDKFQAYAQGADLVAFGAKYVGAMQSAGILCGRKDLVSAAVPQGFIGFETIAGGKSFGRPLKLDRQTIVGVVAALQEWFEMDHDRRLATYEQRLQAIEKELGDLPGLTTSIAHGDGPAPRVLRLAIDPARATRDVAGVINGLWAGSPAIAVGREADSAILINPVTLREEDDAIVASRVRTLLS